MMAGARFADLQKLDRLLANLPAEGSVAAIAISGLAMDSRQIEANYLFLACVGTAGHGMEYIQQAVDRGAVAVVAEPDIDWPADRLRARAAEFGVALVVMPDLGRLVSEIAARFYGYPGDDLRLIGITGTNGKTSVSHFLAQALPARWHCATIGTMGYGFPENLRPGSHTTPDAVLMQAELTRLLASDAAAVAVEVSSHALDQHRVAAVPFHTAVFTNLSRDHLDYHGTLTAYAEAKMRLFNQPGLEQAVINVDDNLGLKIVEKLRGSIPVVVCSRNTEFSGTDELFVRVSHWETVGNGMHLELHTSWGDGQLFTSLLGEFNIDNLMLVLGVMLGWGLPLAECLDRLANVHTVAGRMQRFGRGDEPAVVVDFAHTPDALEQALKALHAHAAGKLICVFGCGGDRDAGKRPLMGAVAAALADQVIVTDDNPRHEAAAGIVDDILQGIADDASVRVIHNRADAIRAAIDSASTDDAVLIAGKGHEQYQQVGDLMMPFDDVQHVKSALSERAS